MKAKTLIVGNPIPSRERATFNRAQRSSQGKRQPNTRPALKSSRQLRRQR